MPRGAAGLCSVRKNAKNSQSSLNLPWEIGQVIPENVVFRPTLTEDGILYKRVEANSTAPVDLPDWAKS